MGFLEGIREINLKEEIKEVTRGKFSWAQSANAHLPFLTTPILKACLVRLQ